MGTDRKRGPDGLFFKNAKHFGRYLSNQNLEAKCGPFLEIVNEYLNGCAKEHYRDLSRVRSGLGFFCEFLGVTGVTTMNDVDGKMITAYLAWGRDKGHKSVRHSIGAIGTFFGWEIMEGRRLAANPVVRGFHTVRQPKRKPRPFEDDDLEQIWKYLNERGNPRLRLAAALAEETGLRGEEISNVRLEDINLKKQTVFVRLPNKQMEEHDAFFDHKTTRYLQEWLAVRKPDRAGDHLLHNMYGKPCTPGQLRGEFNRILCKETRGKKLNVDGLDSFSGHRFRHTMASLLLEGGANAAAIMAQGGWKSFSAMRGYARPSPELGRRSYVESMGRARAARKQPRSAEIGLLEYLRSTKK